MNAIGRKLGGFYFSYIRAEGVQSEQKSVSNFHTKDSARWLIGFNFKKFA